MKNHYNKNRNASYKFISITVVVLFFSIIKINAQSYLDTSCVWNEFAYQGYWADGYTGTDEYNFIITGDTILFNKTYKIIRKIGVIKSYCDPDTCNSGTTKSNYNIFYAVIREENGKFFLVNNSGIEELIYDFTLNVGDKLPTSPCKITKIDTVYLGSNKLKRFYLDNLNYTVIEGVGHSAGFFNYSDCWPTLKKGTSTNGLVCFKKGNEYLQIKPSMKCNFLLTNIYEQGAEKNIIQIYPNPAKDMLTIINSKNEDSYLLIYNLVGELVFQKFIDENYNETNISNIPNGIYLYKLISNESVINIGKLAIIK